MDAHCLLSLLIPTVPRRFDAAFPKLIHELLRQTEGRNDVEVLGLFDNRKRTIGTKRNNLLQMARGDYLAFIDDDDWVVPDYIDVLCRELRERPKIDLLLFDVQMTYPENQHPDCLCHYDLAYKFELARDGKTYRGPPAHIHVWRSSLAKQFAFPEGGHLGQYGEDTHWTGRAKLAVEHHHTLDRVMYYYRANPNTSEAARGD